MHSAALLPPLTYAVLLVEDNPDDAYLIKRAVEAYGRDLWCWTVPDGVDALHFLRREPPFLHVPTPALIIVDLDLPKPSGRELWVRIRQLPAHEGTPVVVLSAASGEREERRCVMLGATAYAQKVMDFEAYFGSVKGIIYRWLRGQPVPPRAGQRVGWPS